MNDDIRPISEETSMPGPARMLVGVLQWFGGLILVMPAAVMRVFPITAPLGAALMKPASQVCYHGGHNFGRGLVETFQLIGRGIGSGARSVQDKMEKRRLEHEQASQVDDQQR